MKKKGRTIHPNTEARAFTLQFLYQCEVEKIFYDSESHFNYFVDSFAVENGISQVMRHYTKAIYKNFAIINQTIEAASRNWTLARMPVTDRCVLRLAASELISGHNPEKVIINEAIELARLYGTKDSASFVNAILDKIVKSGSLRNLEGEAQRQANFR